MSSRRISKLRKFATLSFDTLVLCLVFFCEFLGSARLCVDGDG